MQPAGEGSRNWIGIENPAIDPLIDKVIQASSREALVTATRALDRVLLWNHYVIPQWYSSVDRYAYWDKFQRPEIDPKFGVDQFAWWIDSVREEELRPPRRKVAAIRRRPSRPADNARC